MTDNSNLKIDPNVDDAEKLQSLPGVGPKLASRIRESRPFESIEDLKKVRGVGPGAVERWSDMVSFSPVSQTEVDEESPQLNLSEAEVTSPDVLEARSEAVLEATSPGVLDDTAQAIQETHDAISEPVSMKDGEGVEAQEALEELNDQEGVEELNKLESIAGQEEPKGEAEHEQPESKQPAEAEQTVLQMTPAGLITRSGAIWGMVITGFISLFLAVGLTLAILAGLNTGLLQYATPSQVNSLSTQVKGLRTTLDQLEQDTQGLRDRLDNMEGLGSRISTVEKTTSNLQAELESITEKMDAVNSEISELQTQVDEVVRHGEQIDNFFNGLRNLLNETMPAEGDTP